jgi:putative endonuclease
MTYYVYILECDSGKYYTGYSADMEKRFEQHVSGRGGAKFTRGFPPIKPLAAWEIAGTKGDAMRVEALIKSKTRDEKSRLIAKPSSLPGLIAERYPDREIGIEVIPHLPGVGPQPIKLKC